MTPRKYAGFRRAYALADTFRFNGMGIQLYGEGEIQAGPDSYIGEMSTIQASKGYKVVIGQGCHIAHNVRIYTESLIADQDFSKLPLISKKGDVSIGDHCWLCVNCYVGPGVTIGQNTVVAANSVITKSLPPFSICGGAPAKVYRFKTSKEAR